MNKSAIRKKIYQLRKKNYFKSTCISPDKIFKFLNNKKIRNKIIGGYYPYNYEIDTLNILKKLEKKGYLISLPKIGKNNNMNFYQWSFKDPLSINMYGIPEPISANVIYPDILLIPLSAFDNRLYRIGYGGGYYDRYIKKIKKRKKIITIGLAYSFQRVKKIPINKHDVKLDYVVTD